MGVGAALLLAALPGPAQAAVLGHHAFSWWDDPMMGVVVTPIGGPSPGPASTRLLDLEEWHLDMPQTNSWYAGMAIPGLPANPFGGAGLVIGPLPVPPAAAEAFIYEITNVNYIHGNGGFTFTDPVPPGPGTNYLSGINIADTHGALGIAAPVPGTQFMATTGGLGLVLDLTAGHAVGSMQDWDFNAFAGGGNFEWDIPNEPGPIHPGAPPLRRLGVPAGMSAVFGYAMPGNWLDGINDGWVHSWNQPMDPNGLPMPSFQVNIAASVGGFSGPVPEPTTLGLLGLGGLTLCRRRR
ncbi:MAG: PEP-CTERM sorting domain-containing protein [Phycisphaerae bacterium]